MPDLHNPILLGTVATTLFAIGNLIMKNRAPLWMYVFMFVLIAGTQYLSSREKEVLVFEEYFAPLGGYPIECGTNPNWVNPYHNPNKDVIDKVYHPQRHNPEQKKQYQKEANFHLQEAQRCWREAVSYCWYYPDVDTKTRSKQAFTIAMATIVPADPRTKLVSIVVAILTQYGLDCYDAYEQIQEKLAWCEYHYKLYEHYNHLSKI